MRTLFKTIAGLATAGLLLAQPGLAQDEKSPYAKYRAAVMQTMKGNITALSMVAFGQIEDTGFMQAHAEGLANAAAELDAIFPAGSDSGSDALPAVWAEPDKFAAAVKAIQTSTTELQLAVMEGNRGAVAGAFKKVGDSCKGCHENFRVEQ